MCMTPQQVRSILRGMQKRSCSLRSWLPAPLLGVLSFAAVANAQLPLPPSGDDVGVALVTFGPGDAVFNYFGHNALLIEDRRNGYGVLYNFGMFSFGPEMLPKYMTGRLEFWAGAMAVEPTFRDYIRMNRGIRVDRLNLPADKRLTLARALVEAVQPANRDYLYHHYINNCSTRVRDLIDRAVDGQLRQANSMPAPLSLRDHTRRAIQRDFWLDMLLMYWMNGELDRPIRVWDEAFLPDQLQKQVQRLTYRDANGSWRPLVQSSRWLYRARGRAPLPTRPYRLWPWALAIGVALGGTAVGIARQMRRRNSRLWRNLWGSFHAVVGTVIGVPALSLAFMAVFTDHSFAYWNLNLALANPLTLAALPCGIGIVRQRSWAQAALRWIWFGLAATTLAVLAVAFLPITTQQVREPLALLAPLNLGCAFACWMLRRKS